MKYRIKQPFFSTKQWLLIILFFALLVAGIIQSSQVHASSNSIVAPRSDVRECVDVGTITGMVKERGSVGVTYFSNAEGATIESPLSIEPPFAIAMYDADGQPSTDVQLFSNGVSIWSHSFKTDNDKWSDAYTVTVAIDAIVLTLPGDHASTHLCLLPSTTQPEATVTPTSNIQSPLATVTPLAPAEPTNTPIARQADLSVQAGVGWYQMPTSIETAPEPIRRTKSRDGVPYVQVGASVIVTIEVTNRGNTIAKNVNLRIVTDGVTKIVAVSPIQSGATVQAQYLAVATDGLMVAMITASTASDEINTGDNIQSVLWFGTDDISGIGDDEVCGQVCGGVIVPLMWFPVVMR